MRTVRVILTAVALRRVTELDGLDTTLNTELAPTLDKLWTTRTYDCSALHCFTWLPLPLLHSVAAPALNILWCARAWCACVLFAVRARVLCCAVLCCAVLCCAVLCCAVLCCAVLCCDVLCTVRVCIAPCVCVSVVASTAERC
jgi:hypothetical protein